MDNAFTYSKCYEFGKMLKAEFKSSWEVFTKEDEWRRWTKSREISETQIKMIKRGFMGLLYSGEEVILGSPLDMEIFPFGAQYKGRRFKELPDRYINWLAEQDWLDKWPVVKQYVQLRTASRSSEAATKEDIRTILNIQ